MSWLDAFAGHVATLHPDLVYRAQGAYRDDEFGVIVGPIQARPACCVAVTAYGGAEPDTRLGWHEPNVQLRVRGTADEQVSRLVADALYDQLNGCGSFWLADGTYVQDVIGAQSGPITLGLDDAGRNEHTVNLRTEIRRGLSE